MKTVLHIDTSDLESTLLTASISEFGANLNGIKLTPFETRCKSVSCIIALMVALWILLYKCFLFFLSPFLALSFFLSFFLSFYLFLSLCFTPSHRTLRWIFLLRCKSIRVIETRHFMAALRGPNYRKKKKKRKRRKKKDNIGLIQLARMRSS